MDKRFIWTGIALGSVIAIALAFASLPEAQETVPLQEAVPDVRVVQPSQSQQEKETYLLKEHSGRIAVYQSGQNEPEMILDVLVKYLPDQDRQDLERGIVVESYEELISLIEDYTS